MINKPKEEALKAKKNDEKEAKKKEEKGPMMNNFLNSQTKLKKDSKEP